MRVNKNNTHLDTKHEDQNKMLLTPRDKGSFQEKMLRYRIENFHHIQVHMISFNSHPWKTCKSKILQYDGYEDTKTAILRLINSNHKHEI